ncbi:MAG: transcriptional regulator [Cellvibrio sp. 79]|nr:MAG: transcriptional regulator [Cellvibrio sp. 79]
MLDAIRLFIAVADTGNLSKVAKAQAMAVSSVSRKIDALETELGFQLFHRTSRVILLTDSGAEFLPRARLILEELDEAKTAISARNADPQGLLTITAPSVFGRIHLAPAVMSFLQRYPLMEIDMNVSDEILDLSVHRVDVAIRIGKLPDSDLVATQLAPFQRLVCASPRYLEKYGIPLSPLDLVNHNCLTVKGKGTTVPGLWGFAGVNRNQPLAVKGSFCSNDINFLVQAALDSVGIVHLASWLVSDAIVRGQLVCLFPDVPDIPAKIQPGIHAVRMPGRSHAAKAQLFITHLRKTFGEPAYWDRAITDAVKNSLHP